MVKVRLAFMRLLLGMFSKQWLKGKYIACRCSMTITLGAVQDILAAEMHHYVNPDIQEREDPCFFAVPHHRCWERC